MRLTLNILIVDDDNEILVSFKSSLESLAVKFNHKISISTANNVCEALIILNKLRIDAIFLDYHFNGGMNGDELIDNLPDCINSLYITLISARDEKELTKIVTRHHINLDQQNFPFRYLSKSLPNFTLQLQDVYQQMTTFLSNRLLPNPIAYTLRSIDESDNNFARLVSMKDFMEVSMKYLVAILVADAYHRQTRVILQRSITANVSWGFGFWLGWLKDLSQQAKDNSHSVDFIAEIWDYLLIDGGQESTFLFLNDFKNEVRDKILAHGYMGEDESYRSLVEDWEKRFTKFRENLHFYTYYTLYFVEKVDLDDSDGFNYHAINLMGLDLRPVKKQFSSKVRLKKNTVYMSNSLGSFLTLDPFIRFLSCPTCGFRHVFILDKISGKKIIYRPSCNHTLEDKNSLNNFKILVSERG
jgi:CheY-like chemotaxis protein